MKLDKIIACFLIINLIQFQCQADKVQVHQYKFKKSGKILNAHLRSSSDHSKFNNWSHKGNINPLTGKKGSNK